MNRTFRHLWGWVLVILGVIGLILPVMPGWVFLIPGLVILSDYFPWAKRLVDWAKEKAHLDRGADHESTKAEDKHGADPDRDRT